MIIKGYMTIILATRVDNMFVVSFPKSVIDEVKRINANETEMLMPRENMNSTWIVFSRFFNAIKQCFSKEKKENLFK